MRLRLFVELAVGAARSTGNDVGALEVEFHELPDLFEVPTAWDGCARRWPVVEGAGTALYCAGCGIS